MISIYIVISIQSTQCLITCKHEAQNQILVSALDARNLSDSYCHYYVCV